MRAATHPRARSGHERLLVVHRDVGALHDRRFSEIAGLAEPLDLFVVNDAATLPASLEARTQDGHGVEVRLVSPTSDVAGVPDARRWSAVLFGEGDYRTPTEHRPPPPVLAVGETLDFGALRARLRSVSPRSPRLVELEVDREGAAFWSALYAIGRPIQYAYVPERLRTEDVQTPFASRPWAAEMPSAGRLLGGAMRRSLLDRGARVVTLTHAAGLSSTGDPSLDAVLPLPERYDLPAATVRAIEETRARGARVIAVGTTVTRALEGNVHAHGRLTPGTYVTDLVLSARTRPRVVDGLLTGAHAPETSHFDLLRAFVPERLLARMVAVSEERGYLLHEFGDAWLILGGASRTTPRSRS